MSDPLVPLLPPTPWSQVRLHANPEEATLEFSVLMRAAPVAELTGGWPALKRLYLTLHQAIGEYEKQYGPIDHERFRRAAPAGGPPVDPDSPPPA